MAQPLPLLIFAVLNALSCHSEVRARDPDVEEEEAVGLGRRAQQMPAAFGTAHLPILHDHRHHSTPGSMDPVGTAQNLGTPLGETVHPSAHKGNWCAYVNQRVVTTAVLCATETQTVKSVNRCSDGTPDCQVIMYRLSSRPVYKQKQTTLSSVHWQCCPGYRGHNCLDKDKPLENEEHVSKSSQDQLENQQSKVLNVNDNNDSGDKMRTDQLEDWEDPPLPVQPHHSPAGAREEIPTSQPQLLPLLDSSILLSMHQLMSVMMSQLQPVLEGFNRTLQHLSSEVDALSKDLQQLRLDKSSRSQAHSGTIEEKLEYSHLQISQMKTQLDTHKEQMERTFHTQQELLQGKLTKLKEEIDDQISQSQDAQVNLQSLSMLVEEVRVGQRRLEGTLQRERAESVKLSGGQPAQESRVWEAITRLDEKAQKNSAQLSSLSKTSENTAGAVQGLQEELLDLGRKLEDVKQGSAVHLAETSLEVEATRVRLQNSVNDLSANLSAHEGQLREIELDLDNIYHQLQKNDSQITEQACNCRSIADSLVRLEVEVANVTDLARKTQHALEDADLEKNQARWATEVEDLQHGLLNMKESLAFEQGRSRTLNNNISQLKALLQNNQQEIRGLKEKDEAKSAEIQGLSATFSSLLSDAVRHSEVLEVLLGEEVLEFIEWSDSQQKELSIPNILQKTHVIQQKIETHDRILSSLRKKHPQEGEMHSDDPVAYSDWTSTKNQVDKDSHLVSLVDPSTSEDEDVDYSVSDFWSLGKEVEQLADRITLLEERCGNCTETPGASAVELQANVASLHQSLEDHLRMFEKVFSHTEELTGSARRLNLEEVWRLVKRKERKNRSRQQKQRMERGSENSSSRRSKRYSETEHASLSRSPVVFVTSLDHRTGQNVELTSKNVVINHGGAFSPTSREFHAPETGLYLFLVTLDFESGRSLAVLKRSGSPVASLRREQGGLVSRNILLELRKGETVTLELMRGSLRKALPEDNTLSGLLLFITERKDML